jgi:hypothetical protein
MSEIIKWFFANYERIEDSTPRDDGEWVFIWGEPETTSDLVGQKWGEGPLVEAAIKTIEEEADGNDLWVPVPPAAPAEDDKVNPGHYKTATGLEAIDVIEAFQLDFHRGNAVKYLLRAGKKTGEAEKTELEKARWYIERAIKALEK